jgi:ABC-type lipoprotein release transport system permease subunit
MADFRFPLFRLAWRNIWRHKRRSWLNMAGIGFSTFLFVFVMPIQFGAYDMMIDATLRMHTGYAQIQKKGYKDKPVIYNAIDGAEGIARKIRKSHEFEAVAVRASAYALLSSQQRSYGGEIMGVQTRYEPHLSIIPSHIKQGRFFSGDDAREMVLGSSLARDLRVDIGDEVTILGTGKDGSMAATVIPVVGIFETGNADIDRYTAEIPLHTFQNLFSMWDSAHNISVIGKSIQTIDAIPQQLKRFIHNGDGLVALSWDQLMPGIKQTLQMDEAGGFLFMLVLVIVVVFSILNTFLMLVLERTKEFGLMLALGDKPINISKLVMLEAVLTTTLALAAGMVVAIAINYYFLKEGLRFPGIREFTQAYNMPLDVMYPKFDGFTVLFGPIIVFVSTNIAAWIPLIRIHRLNPVDAMRTI